MDRITLLKARLFDINNAISNLQSEGQKVAKELQEELARIQKEQSQKASEE